MENFSVEEVYKSFKITDEKRPFKTWIKSKKRKRKTDQKKRKISKKDGHIDMFV